ncbi:MAG: hypothetical protein KJ900_10530 [Proteobacteria bacterium]|jgi:hypothetical protein|nr:hypothetical protein [Pseudomonadota bacterium]MCG2743519.1 hypothetical protein [Desulfobacteraceae bacterium]MDO8945583.1 hypothetical protein [Desulfocapsaceae bacterium]MBU4029537.1 hypothetical protein [Pseudomonadota bacterium]MBU4043313.1 hypothetical protein [Pseudomonadota bacterium]
MESSPGKERGWWKEGCVLGDGEDLTYTAPADMCRERRYVAAYNLRA